MSGEVMRVIEKIEELQFELECKCHKINNLLGQIDPNASHITCCLLCCDCHMDKYMDEFGDEE